MKITNIKIIIIICFCCIISGCSNPKEEIVELTMIHGWGSTEKDHIIMRQIYEDFEKEYPNIRLNLVSMPSSSDVVNKVGDLLTIGEIPDIVFTGGDGKESIYEFMVKKGYALNLMPYIQADEEFVKNVSDVILENWTTKDGALYTVSDVLLMGGYWYNKEIFNEAGITEVPKTWDDWIKACDKIKKMNSEIAPVILDGNHMAYLMTSILADENLVELENIKASKINVNSIAFDNMLVQIKEISEYAILAGNYNYRDTLDSFNKGQSAIYINGVWANSMIDKELSVSYASFPSKDGNGIGTMSACVGYILGNTGDEKRMEASVKFLKYMLSEETAKKILEQTGQIPSNPNIEITEQSCGTRMNQAVESIKNAGLIIEIPNNLWNPNEKEEYTENILLFLQNKITEEEFRK
ncbi:MAG: extracellular solute-binding protein [Lachnospiraceae bacterium]|nr:extracellular solute-binding protein [Lachnospiraceae bacterium]